MKKRWRIISGLLVIAFIFALLRFNRELLEEKVQVVTVAGESRAADAQLRAGDEILILLKLILYKMKQIQIKQKLI